MAENSEGGYKRADFFVGVVDLFAILLPGALLTFFLLKVLDENYCYWHCQSPEKTFEGPAAWVAFLIASYILGHFIFIVGSFLLDGLYDYSYKEWFGHEARSLSGCTDAILAGDPYQLSADLRKGSALKWSSASVRLQNPSASAEVDRIEADSKFFRSLTALLLTVWLVSAFLAKERPNLLLYGVVFVLLLAYRLPEFSTTAEAWVKKYTNTRAQKGRFVYSTGFLFNYCTALLVGLLLWTSKPVANLVSDFLPGISSHKLLAIYFSLLFLSSWRFMERRLKRTQVTYEFFISLNKLRSKPTSAGKS